VAKFDVLTEPWIPLVGKGETNHSAGILETLKNAHEYQEIRGETPMETAAVLRLLIAFAMDACQFKDIRARRELYRAGRFDGQVLDDYVRSCLEEGVSFDLFDEKRPFMQSPYDSQYDKATKPIAVIALTLPSGGNHVHFDHRWETEHVFTPAECLPKLLAANLFAVAAAQGYPSSVNGAPCCYIFCNGRSFFHTIVLNMVSAREIPRWEYGFPAWRNKNLFVEPKGIRAKIDVLEAFTWMPRRITLVPPEEQNNVREVYWQQGVRLYSDSNLYNVWRDPHVAFKRNKKKEYYSLKPQIDRAFWRDLGTVAVSLDDEAGVAPSVLRQVEEITEVEETNIVDLLMYGLITNQAQYVDWIEDRLRVPIRILKVPELGGYLRKDVDRIEKAASIVYDAVYYMTPKKEEKGRQKKGNQKKDEFARQARAKFFDEIHTYLFEKGYLEKLSQVDTSKVDWSRDFLGDLRARIENVASPILKEAVSALGLSSRSMETSMKALKIAHSRLNRLMGLRLNEQTKEGKEAKND
jgi:CRISPR system Cascade subunit CasA